MLDKVKPSDLLLLYCLISTLLFGQCKCDEPPLGDHRTGEPSVGREPVIHRPNGGQIEAGNGDASTNESNRLDMINLINNLSDNLSDNSCGNRTDLATGVPAAKANKQARSGISVVHSDLDSFEERHLYSSSAKPLNGETKWNLMNDLKSSAQQKKKNNHRRMTTSRPPTNKLRNQSYQDYIYLEQPSNRHYNKYGSAGDQQNNDQTQAADEEAEKCENLSDTNENRNLLFENVMSTGHDFQAVNNSYRAGGAEDSGDRSENKNDPNGQHRSSTEPISYKTAVNLADDGDYLVTRQPEYPSEHFKPSDHYSKLHQLTSHRKPAHQSNRNGIETPAIESLKLMNKYLDFRLPGNSRGKKLSKQLYKRLDLDESYGEEEDSKNEEEDDSTSSITTGDSDSNRLESGGEQLLSQLSQQLNNRPETGVDFEYSREYDKGTADRNLFDLDGGGEFNGDQNYEHVRKQIQSQIQSQNYNQRLDKLVNQFVANQKKQMKLKRKNSLKRLPSYHLQYLHEHQPDSRYIPLQNLRYAPPQNLRKTRSQSKLRNKLNVDRETPSEPFGYSFLPAFYSLNYPPASWYHTRRHQKKGKVDDSYYRRLIWLKKQALLNSILSKNGLQFKMINHELQPDSSDDLYSYSPVSEFEFGDYDSELTTAIPQSQSMSSIINYPAMMSYASPYRYYSMPSMPSMPSMSSMATMPSYMPMAAPMPASYPYMYPYDSNRQFVPSSSSNRYGDGYQNRHTEHHHEHTYPTPIPMPMPLPMPMHPPQFNHVIRNYKKNDLKEMIWPLLFAVVLPLTFGALLLPLTLMFLVNLFMLLQILRNPNDFVNNNPPQDGDGGAAKIIKYKSELLSPSLRNDAAASNSTETADSQTKSQRRFKRNAIVKHTPLSPALNQRKVDESHLRLLNSLIQFQQLIDQGDDVYLKRNKYY